MSAEFSLDFAPVRDGNVTVAELAAGMDAADLARLTTEMVDLQLEAIADAADADAVLVPHDPEADDRYAEDPSQAELAWTLGHVVAHTTASSEESCALALTVARGVESLARSRYEVPWEEVSTAAAMRERLEESRRMRLAMLAGWPDVPHSHARHGRRDGRPGRTAPELVVGSLEHDEQHLRQMRRIMEQARAARSAGG